MAKIKKDKKKGTPAISTASLPDIVFMLLFFFIAGFFARMAFKRRGFKSFAIDRFKRIALPFASSLSWARAVRSPPPAPGPPRRAPLR